ncbi:tetratricopeptide repeat protein [Actinoplanes sp. NPDC051494]|uniref:tetratricopeptide repeat protein n=1 Tax=Actinoplanes sp. NPDC051494 TaxID=3363907 RepID=UPI00379967C4
MTLPQEPGDVFTAPPDPAQAGSVAGLVERLRLLKVWAGDPSYEMIKDRVNAAWTAEGRPAGELARRSTVANCFQPGRRRFTTDLVLAVVRALHPDVGYVTQWRQALAVAGGETEAVAQVRVQDTLPRDLDAFTGRTGELDRLRLAARDGAAVVITAIEGMAGIGKTQLAVHAGHLLVRDGVVDRVLFVNLRGFHPDKSQPPAGPAAVLDGFLRLLGVPGQRIPHDLAARTAAYRARLTGTRTLVVLDNAATAEQVRPLLADVEGCLTLVTSRRRLTGLRPASRLAVGAFSPAEALAFLAGAVPGVPTGPDPAAAARIAERCGYLPLALSLIAGHIRGAAGWTLSDHADRLDERHRDRRLDSGVEVALALSYESLPAGPRRLLRLVALHPGPDVDGYAAAALAGTDLPTARAWLSDLCRDHQLQGGAEDRYSLHDLVRAFAASRAHDQDPPPVRRAALTRLFDHYLATTTAAVATLYPDSRHQARAAPPDTPAPDLTGREAAVAWLHHERPTLVAVAAHTATHGWPGHTARLAFILAYYLTGAFRNDALAVYGHALRAARASGDQGHQAYALTKIGFAYVGLGDTDQAGAHLWPALELYQLIGDLPGQALALGYLGIATDRSGDHERGIELKQRSLALFRRAGDRIGEARALNGLGVAMRWAGRYAEAIDYYEQASALAQESGNQLGTVLALNNVGEIEALSGRYGPARDHLDQALALSRELGNRAAEAAALDSLGVLHSGLDRPGEAIDLHQQALTILRELGDRYSQAYVLNSLGEAALSAGRPDEAVTHHSAAADIATDLGDRDQQARARTGLTRARVRL